MLTKMDGYNLYVNHLDAAAEGEEIEELNGKTNHTLDGSRNENVATEIGNVAILEPGCACLGEGNVIN